MEMLVTEEAVLRLEDMTDDEFFAFCGANSTLRIERTAEGRIIVMSGTGGKTGNRNSRLIQQLQNWADGNGEGAVFDSSTMFLLPDRAMRSPDAAWVRRERLARLTAAQQEKYLPLCPDFVVELTSPSDRIQAVKEKMEEWMTNGCQLGWILEVDRRRVHVYRPGGSAVMENPSTVAGEGPVEGFTLNLARIWDPGW